MILNANTHNNTEYYHTLLWENPSDLNSRFAKCDISLDLSKYKAIYIIFRQSTTKYTLCGKYLLKDASTTQTLATLANVYYLYYRNVIVTDDAVYFENGAYKKYSIDGSSTSQSDEYSIIPFRIYGVC